MRYTNENLNPGEVVFPIVHLINLYCAQKELKNLSVTDILDRARLTNCLKMILVRIKSIHSAPARVGVVVAERKLRHVCDMAELLINELEDDSYNPEPAILELIKRLDALREYQPENVRAEKGIELIGDVYVWNIQDELNKIRRTLEGFGSFRVDSSVGIGLKESFIRIETMLDLAREKPQPNGLGVPAVEVDIVRDHLLKARTLFAGMGFSNKLNADCTKELVNEISPWFDEYTKVEGTPQEILRDVCARLYNMTPAGQGKAEKLDELLEEFCDMMTVIPPHTERQFHGVVRKIMVFLEGDNE